MKIGITCYPTYGGSGIVATELGMELAARGHEVHFISYSHPIRLDSSLDRVHYHEVEVTNYPLFAYPPYCLALAARMSQVAESYDLDLLHVHYAIPHSISAMLARQMLASRRPLPFITTLHGTDITLVGVEPSYFEITKFSIEESDGITTVSGYLKEQTEQVFGIANPIEVIHNFVNLDRYRPAAVPRAGGRPRLVHISNFRPVKRPLDCVRILERVAREVDVELWMAGDGPERGPAERLAHELKVDRRIRFLGKQDHIEQILPQCDVLLLPSDHEAFGLAALEAMACGVPPVATRVGGVGELIEHGVDGFLEAAGAVELQAQRVLELITEDALYKRISEAARHTAASRFSTDLVIPKYEEFYRRVCAEAGMEPTRE
jgi:N-acetyl-alpha-D-glucosaminyl L-malate synthase BshA